MVLFYRYCEFLYLYVYISAFDTYQFNKLIGIISAMHIYHTPSYSDQGYSQGFWYAIISASLYLICSMILMINMLGYFLGHYPQHFTLTDYQRTLILQTMLFFIWLAGGGALFAHIERDLGELNWAFVDGVGEISILSLIKFNKMLALFLRCDHFDYWIRRSSTYGRYRPWFGFSVLCHRHCHAWSYYCKLY